MRLQTAKPNNRGLTLLEKIHPVKDKSLTGQADKVGGRYTTKYLVGENSLTGLTLIEVLVSLVVTLVLFLALLNASLLSIDINAGNEIRNEGVKIGEEKMLDLRGADFSGFLLADTGGAWVTDWDGDGATDYIIRRFRKKDVTFTPHRRISDFPVGSPTSKQMEVKITWTYRGKTFMHNITNIISG